MMQVLTKADITPYVKQAEKEGLTFCQNTQYYGLYKDNVLLGFTGILWYQKKAVFKNSYVFPEYRKQGVYREMLDHRLKLAKRLGVTTVEATCTAMSLPWYLKNGAQITKQFKKFTQVQMTI